VREVIRCVLLCMLEMLEVPQVVGCVLSVCWEVPEAIRCVLLCMLEMLEVPECTMCSPYAGGRGRWVLFVEGVGGDALCVLHTPKAVEGGCCLLEASEVPEVIRCMLLCMLECWMCRR